MRASTQITLHEFSGVESTEERPPWTVDIPEDDSSSDVGIDSIHEVVHMWGDGYAEILTHEELSGDAARKHPSSVDRGGSR